MKAIEHDELKKKLNSDDDFVLIDVLGEESYEDSHLPGAINIPLSRIGREAKNRFDEDEEIVVYCGSYECDASPQAAEKLEKLGFEKVYDYEGGKKEWREQGYGLQ